MKTLLAILFLTSSLAAPALAKTTLDVGISVMPQKITAYSPTYTNVGFLGGVRVGSKLGLLGYADLVPHDQCAGCSTSYPVRPGAAVVYEIIHHVDIGAGYAARPSAAVKDAWAPTFLIAYKFR